MEFENEFDGVWASASLLHISRNEMNVVLDRLTKVLKQNGILYASFKYGENELENNGRFFHCYEENSIAQLFFNEKNLKLIETWVTKDLRPNRS